EPRTQPASRTEVRAHYPSLGRSDSLHRKHAPHLPPPPTKQKRDDPRRLQRPWRCSLSLSRQMGRRSTALASRPPALVIWAAERTRWYNLRRSTEGGRMNRMLRRSLTVLMTVAAMLLSRAAFAQQDQDFSKVQIKVTKVAGNVYMLEGAGGNIGASVGEDGIVIVDDQYAPLADKIQASLKGITDKPVRFIINTHFHEDHTGGNTYFQKQAPIIAQDNVRKRLEAGGGAGNGSSIHMDFKPAPKEALPIITFDHDVTVHLNGEDIRALYFPAGHTDGDSIIFFPKSNV